MTRLRYQYIVKQRQCDGDGQYIYKSIEAYAISCSKICANQ